jgi:hypothetical protein
MAATTTTTIPGVSLATRRGRKRGEVFDLALSPDGLEIRWPGQPPRPMPWSRISEWEIEERPDDVLLFLRGDGSTTPLLIPGWTPHDLEVLMRDLSTRSPGPGPAAAAPVMKPDPTPGPTGPAPASSRSEWRRRVQRSLPWKTVATVVLLAVVAAAVAVVLLQSAGLISWGFLGPTA